MSLCSDFGHSRLPVKKTAKRTAAGGRRRPVQGRSQATVEALLEAAAQILARHGAEAATTNAIAERAGVSIGSLYQYFADREALVDELTARHIAQMQAVMLGVLQEPEVRAIGEQAVRIVRAILAAHRVNPRLHQALHQLLPVRGMSAIDRFEAHMEQVVEALLVAREGLAPATAERTAVVLVRTIGGLVRTSLRRDPGRFEDPAVERALARMIVDCVTAAREGDGAAE
jgi:AcrR family transcriptional regulator